jgi:O-6-methylguanine DNA methyltransferase
VVSIVLTVRAESYRYSADGWGVGEVWVTAGRLVLHELACARLEHHDGPADATRPRHGGSSSPGVTIASEVSQVCADFVPDLCRRFVAQLAGVEVSYDDVPIDLDWCTPLQRDLGLALRDVKWGEIVSYGELAERAGRPRAPRAAGSFCAQNHISLVLPCHRVVAVDGIGGYGTSGVALKRRLLALEGVVL